MRECGKCTRCCYVLNVPEYNSPPNNYCSNCAVNEGCTIHNERKWVCRDFSCLWLNQPQIPIALRPDNCHVMFELPAGCSTYIGYVDQDFPNAYNTDEVRNLIQKITEAGHPVLIYQGENKDKLFALPEGMTKEEVQLDVKNAVDKHLKEGRI